jgi:hypothetical protein
MKTPSILISLAGKQIWPHVLAISQLKPQKVFLLHSKDVGESKGPAQRLKRFFDDSGLAPKGGTRLELVSDSDFAEIERRMEEIQRVHQLPLSDCAVNFTGGNKLMATAAFRWGVRHAQAFYLERRNHLTWFSAPDGQMDTRTEPLDAHLTDDLDPVALLRCQLDASEVQRPGQTLKLKEAGRKLTEEDFFGRILNGQAALPWLEVNGEADRERKDGDDLEFAAGAVLLRLGVKRVQRSLRLKVKSSLHGPTRDPHAEIDLLFTWGGRLWLVDCKDQRPVEDLAGRLRRCLPSKLSVDAEKLFDRIRNELSIGQTKAMKEDLLAMREAGGLLGHVVCVRKAQLPDEVAQFARNNNIAVIYKNDLAGGFRNLLSPDSPASGGDLADLAAHFRK